MTQTPSNVLDIGDQIPVSATLACLLQALELGASVTFTFPTASEDPIFNVNSASAGNSGSNNGGSATTTLANLQAALNAATLRAATTAPSSANAGSSVTTAVAPVVASAGPIVPTAPANVPGAAPVPVVLDPAAVAAGVHGAHLPNSSEDRYYVVTVGRRLGVFMGWSSVSPFVQRVTGSTYSMVERGLGARNRAITLFNAAWAEGVCTLIA
ncbi:hypothetical protein H0H93_015736 [Arthromyces matolae]|nr:hypothetical protein H0H93_015736 [Arthromyces matolae]